MNELKSRVCRRGHLVVRGTTGIPKKDGTIMCRICNTEGEKRRDRESREKRAARKAVQQIHWGTE